MKRSPLLGGLVALSIFAVTGSAMAQLSGWSLVTSEVGSECAGPILTYFTTTDGRQLEATRLELSERSAAWTQRGFFSDGTPIFETTVDLDIAVPEVLDSAGAATISIMTSLEDSEVTQGSGGSLVYRVDAKGAELDGVDGPVRIDALNPDDTRRISVRPIDDDVEVALKIRGGPCPITWTWRRDGAEVVVAAEVEPKGAASAAALPEAPTARDDPPSSTADSGTRAADATVGDPQREANRLVVRARRAYDQAASLTGQDRSEALQQALEALNQIIDDYPGSDHAVSLIGGNEVAGVSIPALEQALAEPDRGDSTSVAAAEDDDDSQASGPKATVSKARRMTLVAALLESPMSEHEDAGRLGVGYLTRVEPFRLLFGLDKSGGALVTFVAPGGPAEKAGLQEGDMVVAVDGREVEDAEQLSRLIGNTPSSIPVDIEIIRIGDGPASFLAELVDRSAHGEANALIALGEVNYYGIGKDYSLEEAFRLFRRAGDAGDLFAARKLGEMYEYGLGTEVDYAQATRWYKSAAAGDDPYATYRLALLYRRGHYWDGRKAVRDDDEAVRLLREAAQGGEANAYFYLGLAYQYGRGVEQNYDEAVRWYRRDIDAGGGSTSYDILGQLYYFGKGVKQDYTEARRLFEKGAERGNMNSRYMLGQIYRLGQGTAVDHERAIAEYRAAANDGSSIAMYWLGLELRDKGGRTIAERAANEREAFEWLEKASDAGYFVAHYAVAASYALGRGVVQNYAKGGEYLAKAIEDGHNHAVTEMKTNAKAWPREVLTTLQRYLRDEGLYDGKIDGDVGPGTIRAIEALYDRGVAAAVNEARRHNRSR